jgi:hypothetical protein
MKANRIGRKDMEAPGSKANTPFCIVAARWRAPEVM